MFPVAWKDLVQTFRSPFSLAMMFAAPLLITGLLFFAFGNLGGDGEDIRLPETRVVVVNLDAAGTGGLAAGTGGLAAGRMLVENLRSEELADLLKIRGAASRAEGEAALRAGEAEVMVLIPRDFSGAVVRPGGRSRVEILHDPAAVVGPRVVAGTVRHFVDGFAGSTIAVEVAAAQLRDRGVAIDPTRMPGIAEEYARWLQESGHGEAAAPLVRVQAPRSAEASTGMDFALAGPIMAGMMIFFLFFIGANGASSILREQEEGTLSRLRATPVPLGSLLSGKLAGVLAALAVQAAVLLAASSIAFRISWGPPGAVLAVAVGTIVAAGGFGIMLMSFLRSSRQTGPVLGGVITIIGMLGGLMTTGLPQAPPALERFSLVVPTGWALRGLRQTLAGAPAAEVLVTVLVLLAMGAGFMLVGLLGFRRRFAR